ncbi:MAG: CocE/NonD family hydrolase [Pseudomonadota bacterium]
MNLLKTAAIALFLTFGFACSGDPAQQEPQNKDADPSVVMGARPDTPVKVSEFGRYEGYSKPIYDEYIRSSVYVPMRDAVKVAIDIYRPAIDGVAVDTPLPVILIYSRYLRARKLPDGSVNGIMGNIPPGEVGGELKWSIEESQLGNPYLMSHGYIIARAESRGTGASMGIYPGEYSVKEAEDGHDLIEWLGSQSFSNGNVGMAGGSYAGSTQYSVLRHAPPKPLKAIFPGVALIDPYQTWISGAGVYRKGIMTDWTLANMSDDGVLENNDIPERKKARGDGVVVPVDEDIDGRLLASALSLRRSIRVPNYVLKMAFDDWNAEIEQILMDAKDVLSIESDIDLVRLIYGPTDVLAKALAQHPELSERLIRATRVPRDLYSDLPDNFTKLLPQINASGIPIYNWGGWRDVYADAMPLWYVNLTTPKKLTMGPWSHSPKETDDLREDAQRLTLTIEQLRWFDHFLKGIDNGILDEPEVHYAVNHSPTEWEWRQDDQWPPSGSMHQSFYFADGPSGSIASVNDGLLSRDVAGDETPHAYAVDYTTTMGTQDRYYDAIKGIFKSVDLVKHAKTGLTYTTPPLEEDLVIAGHPIVRLKASSTASDGDFMVYLEEVDSDGSVHFLTDGLMRGSYRTLGKPDYDYLGMPWSVATADAVDATPPLNAGTASLEFPMKAIANRFEKGHRIRVVVTGADSDGTLLIPLSPPPTQKLMIGGASPSLIELPILK